MMKNILMHYKFNIVFRNKSKLTKWSLWSHLLLPSLLKLEFRVAWPYMGKTFPQTFRFLQIHHITSCFQLVNPSRKTFDLEQKPFICVKTLYRDFSVTVKIITVWCKEYLFFFRETRCYFFIPSIRTINHSIATVYGSYALSRFVTTSNVALKILIYKEKIQNFVLNKTITNTNFQNTVFPCSPRTLRQRNLHSASVRCTFLRYVLCSCC